MNRAERLHSERKNRSWRVMFRVLVVFGLLTAGWSNVRVTGAEETVFKQLREQMVERQIQERGVKDSRVLQAMLKVERHRFVPSNLLYNAYADFPLPIGEGQTISQPYIVALMTELLSPHSSDKVLEIGTGSGYQAAILAELVKEVYTIEIIKELGNKAEQLLKSLGYQNIRLRVGDGYRGWPEQAPFDGILVTAAPGHIPQPLLDQLKVGGRMIIPVGDSHQELMRITKEEKGIKKETILPVRFVPMTGEAEKR